MQLKVTKISIVILIAIYMVVPSFCGAQTCPANIGFEMGNFTNWQCYSGKILSDGSLNLTLGPPQNNIHTINTDSYPQVLDFYGNFPVTCPNGSKYSIRLGNNSSGAGAESVSYTFTIPAGQNDYGIIYNYAVVFQNPNHQDYQQPRFTSKVFDVTAGQYLSCGAFQFIASGNIDGFQLSPQGSDIFYKPWSPITVKLFGLAGRTIRLEFTNNDCSPGGHFGYAYLDVNENCSSPISGNTYCNGANSIKLTAPFGFAGYQWYTSDFSTLLGTSNVLTISPPPPPNTEYALIIEPYPGLGCRDTLRTTIHKSPDAFTLNIVDSVVGCNGTPIDLTAPFVTAGSSPGLTLSYYLDPDGINYLPSPQYVTTQGTYYIKGVNSAGCNEIKPIKVVSRTAPNLVVSNPAQVCFPATVDITAISITSGSEAGLSYTYWTNQLATVPLLNPVAIATSGTYYIKGASTSLGCSVVVPVNVSIASLPDFTVRNPSGCAFVDLTNPAITLNNTTNTYSFWQDVSATVPVVSPNKVTSSGIYYMRATSPAGCLSPIKPITVSVNGSPLLTIVDPLPVDYPATIDITNSFNHMPGNNYSYWKDTNATISLDRPARVESTGTYYIKATSIYGCVTIMPVKVLVIPPPDSRFIVPNAFSPNKDGINDQLYISIVGVVEVKRFIVFNRWGQAVFETKNLTNMWDGTQKGQPLPMGVYYWMVEAADLYNKKTLLQNGSVTLIR